MNSIKLAFRNLSRQKKRSFLLCGAIAFGFFVVTAIDSLTGGLLINLSNQFANLFGGNVMVMGTERNADDKLVDTLRDSAPIERALAAAEIPYVSYTKRSQANGKLIFNGQVAMINIFGCDFEKEAELADALTFVEGSFKDATKSENALIIGEATAKKLKAELGDTIVYQTQTVSGQATFGEFVITGITKDATLLGSLASYAPLSYMNTLLGVPSGGFMMYSIMLKDQSLQREAALQLEAALKAQGVAVTDLQKARTESPNTIRKAFMRQIKETNEPMTYAVLSLNDEMGQVEQIMAITQAATTGILLVLFFVVMIGISNTFKMIIYERIREIGTMRACGMHQSSVGRMLTWEALLLSVLGAVAGLVLAVVAMKALSIASFDAPELSLFLDNGHWTYVLSPVSLAVKFALIMLLTAFAVSGSAKQAAKMNPAEALRTVK